MIQTLLFLFLIHVVIMTFFWMLDLKLKNGSLGDLGWIVCLMVSAFILFPLEKDTPLLSFYGLVIFLIWAFRIFYLVFVGRILNEKEEDSRYRALRKRFEKNEKAWFFLFFQMQSLFAIGFILPYLSFMWSGEMNFHFFHFLGGAICLLSVFGEGLSDHQLYHFKKDPQNKGSTCQVGLWNYSRHPNYFFEWLFWFGFFLMGIKSPYVWVGFVGMLNVYLCVRYFTGIPFSEKMALAHREDYAEYQRTTNILFLGPKKRG